MACMCLNMNAHPEQTKGCSGCCGMCCGYTPPAVIGLLIAGLVISSDVYSIILIARNPHSAWRVTVCLIVLLLTTFFGVVVNWAYYQIIFTPPGYVPRETWQHSPTYVGPPLVPLDQNQVQVHFPVGYHGALPTYQEQPILNMQQQAPSQLTPTMTRRPPDHSGYLGQTPIYPTRSLLPSSQQPPPFSPTQSEFANPLQSTEDAETRKSTAREASVATPVAAVMYSDMCGNDQHHHRELNHRTVNSNVNQDDNYVDAEVIEKLAAEGPSNVRVGSHSPYATPNCNLNRTPVAAVAAKNNKSNDINSGAPPLNPYQVRERNANGTLRYCHMCNMYKPDGAHHCRVCRRCVYNFDHHCPFVNNCVGRNNYKLFVIFVLYGGVGATLAGGLMAVTLFAVDRDEITTKIGWVAVPAIDVVLGLSLLAFYIEHRCLLCRGESTLDSIARGDDTFQGWLQSLSRPRLTAAEKAELHRQRQLKVERHNRTLLGNESPWWRRYLPLPVRTDDTAEDTVPGNV